MDATVGYQLIIKHLIVNLDINEMRKQRPACQDMIEHLGASVMQYREAPVLGQRALDGGQHSRRQMT